MKIRLLCLLLASKALLGAAADEPKLMPITECIQVPIRVHLLRSGEIPAANTRLDFSDIERIINKANRVWLQAGILLVPQMIAREDVPLQETRSQFPLTASRSDLFPLRNAELVASNVLNIYYIHEFDVNGIYFPQGVFVKDSASLRSVEEGIDEPLPRVTSHEIGHAFGLDHRQNRTNLMASGTTGIWLNADEINLARRRARDLNDSGSKNRVDSEVTKSWYDRASAYVHGWSPRTLIESKP